MLNSGVVQRRPLPKAITMSNHYTFHPRSARVKREMMVWPEDAPDCWLPVPGTDGQVLGAAVPDEMLENSHRAQRGKYTAVFLIKHPHQNAAAQAPGR